MKRVLLLLFALALPSCSFVAAEPAPLDFPKMMQPIPATAAFRDPGYYVWCGTMIRGDDGKYHLYYSRWKVSDGFQSWVTRSEVAHAVGDSPEGPFAFHDVTLPARGKQFWDGLVTHNPTIHRFGKKYYLYYMGDTGDGVVMPDLNWGMRNNQRVGVAVADNPAGPWKRFDHPVVDASADPAAPDSLCATNPSLTQGRDGRFYLLYKAVGRQKPLPFGGPVVHLMAVSNSPTGPFHKDLKPLFTIPGNNFPFEDPFFWYDRKRDSYFVILKDNKGIISGLGHSSLVLYQSKDASHWERAEHSFVSDLQLQWEDRPTQRVDGLERPQLTFDAEGNPIALVAAIREDDLHSFNVRIPLVANAPAAAQSAPPVPAKSNPANSAAADFAQLARYRDANAASQHDAKQPVRVVFLGDSILDRWGRDAGIWFTEPGWINRGIGGQTTSQMLLRERNDVLALHPRAVVLEGGSNDMRLGFTPEAIRDNLASMGELAEAHHLRVFVATMTPVCDCVRPLTGLRTVDRIAQLNNMLKELCSEHHWVLIDLNPPLADAHGLMRAELTSDGVHPNDKGYKPLAEVITYALKQLQ